MSFVTDHPRLRWAAPAAAIAVTAAATFAVSLSGNASADPTLGPRTPAQLLVDVQQARLAGVSGTVVQTSNLGLPELTLPGAGGGGSSELASTVSGTHTWRVWYAGPDKARLALTGAMGESDIVRNGRDVWLWSSRGASATHYTVPAGATATGATPMPTPSDLPKTPQEAADRALAALDPSTVVSSPGTTTVAGRAAYELVLTPREAGSLVASVRIAVDGEQRVPLRVQVFSTRVGAPAFEVGFTSVDFTVPEARQFAFDPPPGTKVTEGTAPTGDAASSTPAPADKGTRPRVVGTGWSSVMVAAMPATSADQKGSGGGQLAQLQGVLSSLPKVSGTWGSGRLLNGTLFSVLLTDDGRVVAGAVEPQRLYAALSAR